MVPATAASDNYIDRKQKKQVLYWYSGMLGREYFEVVLHPHAKQ